MLFPNFHSKYADTIEKCFYNDNINNLNVSFTYPMLKQLYPYNNELYMIYESTAYAYRYTPGIKIDHIVNLNKKILQ